MRGKRSKQYRKLMLQYGLGFGFREPYQVLLDAEMVQDANRFKMDLVAGLERTLHGKVKPMITQCCMRHLYTHSKEPGMSLLIDGAKQFERRRCGHLPGEYPEPLSAVECISSVVDPKKNKTNKHRYVVASQELEIRKEMREIMGVPLIYINRSVMIMEPMAEASEKNVRRDERGKFRDGIKSRVSGGQVMKRKRDEDENEDGDGDGGEAEGVKKKKKQKGAKGPNPLSMMKSKRPTSGAGSSDAAKKHEAEESEDHESMNIIGASEPGVKRRRRRKHKATKVEEGTSIMVNRSPEEKSVVLSETAPED